MTQLTNQSIATTYSNVLTFSSATQGLSGTLNIIQDGFGNNSPLLIATNAFNINRGVGQFQLDGVAVTATAAQINSTSTAIQSVLGTNNQITVTPAGTTSTISLAPHIILPSSGGVNEIDFVNLTIRSTSLGTDITNASLLNISAVTGITISCPVANYNSSVSVFDGTINIKSSGALDFSNVGDTLSTRLRCSPLISQSTTFFLPTAYPASNNMSLVSDTTGDMSWIQVIKNNNITFSQTLEINNEYLCAGGALSLLLPSAASINDKIIVNGNTGSWVITQNAGQSIKYLNSTTTTGVGGTLSTAEARGCVELTCVVANTTWQVTKSVGTLNLV